MKCGAVIVAYGDPARREAGYAIAAWRLHNREPVVVVSDRPLDVYGAQFVKFTEPGPLARWAKLHVDRLVPKSWESFVYLDADTRAQGSLRAGFDIIADGWDVAITASTKQGCDSMWHIGRDERQATWEETGNPFLLQLQGGLMFVRQCMQTCGLFEAWREEWGRWRDKDQAALLRALHRVPVKLWLLGRPWNGGALVRHRYGQARGE